MNVSTLLGCDTARLERAAEDLRAAHRAVDVAGQDARDGTAAALSAWDGPAASSARRAAEARTARTDELLDTLDLLRRVLLAAADALSAARALLTDGLDLARRHDLAVTDDGRVAPPPPYLIAADAPAAEQAEARADFDARSRAAATAGAMVRQALDAAQEASSDAAVALRRAAASARDGSVHDAADRAAVEEVTLRDVPASGTDPREVAAWWATLTPAAAALLVARFPERVGALDGVPVHHRDVANRRVLTESLADARDDLAAAEAAVEAARAAYRGRGDEVAVLAALRDAEAARARLAMLESVQAGLAGPDRHLMLLDTTMPGRAAVALGDVDTADHVAVLVPGLNSFVTGYMDTLTTNAHTVRTVAEEYAFAAGSSQTVATVAWIGYEAPTVWTVASDQHARVGAEHLTATLWGIEAHRQAQGEDVHLTTVGHSYGSLTSGLAAAGDTPLDDLVLIGSPGVGVDHVRDLALPADRVFVGEARRDVVSDLDHFGSDPAHRRFGAVPFQTDGGEHPLGGTTRAATGHSEYYGSDTESLWNIVSVVVEERDSVTVGHTLGAGDVLRGAWDGLGGTW